MVKSLLLAGVVVLSATGIAKAQDIPRYDAIAHCRGMNSVLPQATFPENPQLNALMQQGRRNREATMLRQCVALEQLSYNWAKEAWQRVPAATRRNCAATPGIVVGATYNVTQNYQALMGCVLRGMADSMGEVTWAW